ncbi:MAG: beta-lactamase family protein [Spirochaetales bacterium]|nr:beta-lactamase family protein [Spirochaetales bacterium]
MKTTRNKYRRTSKPKLKIGLKLILAWPIGMSILLTSGCTSNILYLPPPDHPSTAFEELLTNAVNEFELPGVQAGYQISGQLPVLAASGTYDLKHNETRIHSEHSFHVGSTTKMIMAALIMHMIEQGNLRLNDTIDQWFPDYQGASCITILQLLNHTSGIEESMFKNVWILIVTTLNKNKIWDAEEVMDRLWKPNKLIAESDRSFIYSNNNYILLGIIAEKIYGISLSDILNREFFSPLEMYHTALMPGSGESAIQLVPGYDEYIPFGPHRIGPDNKSWDSLSFAAGGIVSNSADLLILMDALFRGDLLAEDSISRMMEWTDSRDNGRDDAMIGYGLGLALYQLGDKQLIGHPGGGFGGECFPFWSPETDNTYVVMYNLSRKDNPAGKELLKRIMELGK